MRPLVICALALIMAACGSNSGDQTIVDSDGDVSDSIETPISDGGTSDAQNERATLTMALTAAIIAAAPNDALSDFILPDSDDWDQIPQDPANPVTPEKVALGKLLFHETALATQPNNSIRTNTYSCASCHLASMGFKPGIPQGIGEGGNGSGSDRRLAPDFDAFAPTGSANLPDLQPIAVPVNMHGGYQEALLWNGSFGNARDGVINAELDDSLLIQEGTPLEANRHQLPGLETQAITGLTVHRMEVWPSSILQTNAEYQALFEAAYPDGSDDVQRDAGNAIAAYERTVLANQAPFQRWLRGNADALSNEELRGAQVFFDTGNCVACHTGPALSSFPGASSAETFFAVGMRDFDLNDSRIHGPVPDEVSRGRGGFTGDPRDDYKFKVPQLYNLSDSVVFGHGSSFSSLQAVVEYKNTGVPQNPSAIASLDPRFEPLGLTAVQIDDLVTFLRDSLRDPDLARYVPERLPSGNCIGANDPTSQLTCAVNEDAQ